MHIKLRAETADYHVVFVDFAMEEYLKKIQSLNIHLLNFEKLENKYDW